MSLTTPTPSSARAATTSTRGATMNADVIVVGGGIAGLAAAVRCADLGLTPLVLEASDRVGGRMTTDRIGGFVIDRGVTLPTRSFRRMRALARRFGLGPLMRDIDFTLGIRDDDGGTRAYRARHFEDILLDTHLSPAARFAFVRTGLDLARFDGLLAHGDGDKSARLDTEDTLTYVRRFGPGGEEMLRRVFGPGIRGAIGMELSSCSRAVLFTVARNTMRPGFWNLTGGVDQIPEAMARSLDVLRGAKARHVRVSGSGVEVDVAMEGGSRTLRARAAILATPGQLAAAICPSLPEWLGAPLRRTEYSRIVCAYVAWSTRPARPCTGYAFERTAPSDPASVELEHLRAPAACPSGAALFSVYFCDTPDFRCLMMSDDEIAARAIAAVRRTCDPRDGHELFVHVVRWEHGLARFGAGRFKEVAEVRRRLASWDQPLDCCGDYLDGIASEGALRTGEQAAQRLARRLAHTAGPRHR